MEEQLKCRFEFFKRGRPPALFWVWHVLIMLAGWSLLVVSFTKHYWRRDDGNCPHGLFDFSMTQDNPVFASLYLESLRGRVSGATGGDDSNSCGRCKFEHPDYVTLRTDPKDTACSFSSTRSAFCIQEVSRIQAAAAMLVLATILPPFGPIFLLPGLGAALSVQLDHPEPDIPVSDPPAYLCYGSFHRERGTGWMKGEGYPESLQGEG